VAGRVGKEMLENGDMEAGVLSCGQCMGLVRTIPTCQQLLDQIMEQAEALIKEKFSPVIRGY